MGEKQIGEDDSYKNLNAIMRERHLVYETALRQILDTLTEPMLPEEIAKLQSLNAKTVKANLKRLLPEYPMIGMKDFRGGRISVIYRKRV